MDTSVIHYGYLSNGTNLNRTYRVNTYYSYLGIYSTGLEDSTTDTNDSNYYSVTVTFDAVVKSPSVITYKKFRKATSGAYGNSIFTSALTFYDDVLSSEFAQSATVTPTTAMPNAFIAEASNDATTDTAIAVIRSTSATTPIALLEGQNSTGSALWKVLNDTSGNAYFGASGSLLTYIGNPSNPQASFGASSILNAQGSNTGTTKIRANTSFTPLQVNHVNGNISLGTALTSNTATVLVQANDTSDVALRVYRNGLSTANLQEWTDSADTSYAYMNYTGSLYLGAGTAASPSLTWKADPNTGIFAASDIMRFTAGGTERVRISTTGISIGTSTTTVDYLSISAGTTAISQMKIDSGPLTTGGNIRVGQLSFLTDKLYFVISTGTARKEITLNDIALTSGRVPFATTNGRLTDDADFTFATDTLSVTKLNV